MKTRTFLVVAMLVAVLVTAAVFLVRGIGEKSVPPAISAQEPPAPSKENVSTAIRERIQHLRQVVEKDPKNERGLIELAQLLQDSHNAADAASFYEKALRVNPANTEARIDYALCLHEMGQRDAAMQQCRLVLRSNPGSPQALFNIGSMHANTGLSDSAIVYWRELVRRHPDHELAAKAKENIAVLTGKPVLAH